MLFLYSNIKSIKTAQQLDGQAPTFIWFWAKLVPDFPVKGRPDENKVGGGRRNLRSLTGVSDPKGVRRDEGVAARATLLRGQIALPSVALL